MACKGRLDLAYSLQYRETKIGDGPKPKSHKPICLSSLTIK